MTRLIALGIALSAALGCAGAPRSQTSAAYSRPPPGDCPSYGCGTNGTRAHGTIGEAAPRVESVTTAGSPASVHRPTSTWGSNGTLVSGSVVADAALRVDSVTMPTAAQVQP